MVFYSIFLLICKLLFEIKVPASLQELLLVESSLLEGFFHSDLEQALARELNVVPTVQESHLLVDEYVRITHVFVVLRDHHINTFMPVDKRFELLFANQEWLNILASFVTRIFAF